MKHIIFIALLFTACNSGPTTQTKFSATLAISTPLTFTPLAGDYMRPGAGAEHWGTTNWDDKYVPTIPAGNTVPLNYYDRFNWKDIESDVTPGSYTWARFDQLTHQAIDAGGMFSFGVMPICQGCGATYGSIPTYLHNLMQKETATTDWLYSGLWIPNWNSPSWQARWAALIKAVADHINTTTYKGVLLRNALWYVDIRGYGNFGEWHNYPWRTSTPKNAVATSASLKAIVESVKSAFPDNQLVITMGAWDTGNDSQVPADFVDYILSTKNNFGYIGGRRDNFGDGGYNGWLSGYDPRVMNIWKVAPFVGEPATGGNDKTGVDGATTGCGYPMCDLMAEINQIHASSFGNGNYGAVMTNTNAKMTAAIRAASAACGYKISLTGGSISGSSLTLNWINTGIAPVYEKWDTYLELRSGTKVIWSQKSAFNPRYFLPGSQSVTDQLPSGQGDLYLIIKDPNGYKKPLPLAITGRQADGSYLIKAGVTIGGVVVPPVITGPDTVYLPAGAQPGFQTKSNTVYINKGGQVVFTTQVKLAKDVSFISSDTGYGFKSITTDYSVFGSGMGGNQNISLRGFDFGNTANVVFDASTKIWVKAGQMLTYDGTPATAVFWNLKVDHYRYGGKTKLFEGPYDSCTTLHMISDSLYFHDGICENDGTGENIKVSGNSIYDLTIDGLRITGPTINMHDCGIVFIAGNAHLSNIYRNGGWGYLWRIINVFLRPGGNSSVTGCIDVNGTHYGSGDGRIIPEYLVSTNPKIPLYAGDFITDHNTIGDKIDGPDDTGAGGGGYVTNAYVIGDMKDGTGKIYTFKITNTIAFNASNLNGQNGGSSLIKNNSTAVNLVTGNNIDLKPGVPLPAGYFVDKIDFVPVKSGPLDGTGSGGSNIGAVQTVGVPPVVIPPVVIHDTVTIHDTIPRVCPVCQVCPVQRTAIGYTIQIVNGKFMLKTEYDDGTTTEQTL